MGRNIFLFKKIRMLTENPDFDNVFGTVFGTLYEKKLVKILLERIICED